MNPYPIINFALADAPLDQHEQILRGLLSDSSFENHALRTEALVRLVELLSSRLTYLENQVRSHESTLSHHNLDV